MPNNNNATFITFVTRDGRKINQLIHRDTLAPDDLTLVVEIAKHVSDSFTPDQLAAHNQNEINAWSRVATAA